MRLVERIHIDHHPACLLGLIQALAFLSLQHTCFDGGVDHRLPGCRLHLAFLDRLMQRLVQRGHIVQQVAGRL